MAVNSFRKNTLIGLVMAAGVVVGTKSMALISQWMLGFFLSPEEFGRYAMVLGAMAFVGFTQDPGIGRLHTQMRLGSGELWNVSRIFTQRLALAGSSGLVLIVLTAYDYNHELLSMVVIVALSFPLVALYSLLKSRLEILSDFKTIAQFQLISSAVFSIFVVFLAWYGMGGLSFAVATFFAASCVALFVFFKTKDLKRTTKLNDDCDIGVYRNKVLWTLLGSFVLGFSLRSDYFVVGVALDEAALGVYYFGFMLSANIGLVLSQAMGAVLMPAFSSVDSNAEVSDIYYKVCKKLLIVGCSISLLSAGA